MKPTSKQLAALQRYADRTGYHWKRELIRKWKRDSFTQRDKYLREIRDTHSAAWLRRQCTIKPVQS